MSVEVTRLPSRSHDRDRRDAASGDRFARRLGRLRQPRRAAGRARHFASARAHGVQGHHAAHRAPDRRGDRGGRRRSQCRDLGRDHRLLCSRAQGRRAAGARCALRHPVRSGIRSGGIAARAERDRAGDRRRRRYAGRSDLGPPADHGISGSAGRPFHPRHARDGAVVRSRSGSPAISTRNYRAPDMVVAAAGAVDHRAVVGEVEQRFAAFQSPGERPRPKPPGSSAVRTSSRAISNRCTSRSRCRACRIAIPIS